MSVVLSKSGHSATLKRCSTNSANRFSNGAPGAGMGSFISNMSQKIACPAANSMKVTPVLPNSAKGTAESLVQSLDEKIVALMREIARDESKGQQGKTLNKFIGAVIVINTIMLGLELDLGPGINVPPEDRLFWFCMESFFNVIFIIELLIHMSWERRAWIFSMWNWLDFAVVVMDVLETWVLSMQSRNTSGLKVVSLLRIVRLVRLVRVVKLLRMFRGLYMTLHAFREAISSIAHLGTLLVTGLYVCSIFTTATIGHSERLKAIQMGSVTAEDRFGTVPRSMYSLFELMTLEGWDQVGRPLVEEEPLFSLFLFMFIMVFTFGLLNMIVAFVVEKTMKQAKVMGDLSQHESQREVAQGLLQMKTIFEEADTDGNGTISKKEFLEALATNAKVQDGFERVGIPTHDAETLYAVIDADGSGILTMEELLEGCARIRGASNPEWDLLAMHSLLRCLARQVNKVRRDQNKLQQNKMSVFKFGRSDSASSPGCEGRSESSEEIAVFPRVSSLGSLPDMAQPSDTEEELRTVIAQQGELIKRQELTVQQLQQEARDRSEERAQLLKKLEMLGHAHSNQPLKSPSADIAAGTACSSKA